MSYRETNKHLAKSQQLLIQECISGNRASQARLYTIYASKMMGVCMWYVRNREEAEEVLQDGFLRAFKYLKTYNGKGCFEGWLRRVMISAALTKFRSKAAHLPLVIELNTEIHDTGEEPVFGCRYDEQRLVKLIQTLSPAYRMVFNLYVFEGLKHLEIAEMLQISESTSKSNLADARKILQAHLCGEKMIVNF